MLKNVFDAKLRPNYNKNKRLRVNRLMRHTWLLGDIAAKLDQLTKQLNEYKPAQEATVTAQGERLSADAEQRLELQSSRLENFARSLQETREEQQSTSDTLQTILVSMENLSDNLRRLHEETLQWRNPEQHMEDEEQGREDQAILDSLLHDVPLIQSPDSETVPVSAVSLTQIPISTPGPNLVRNEPVLTVYFGNGEHRIPFLAVSMNESVKNVQSAAQFSFWGIQVSKKFFKTSKTRI